MTRVQRNALVPFSPSAMYRLVDDVESYPAFLPWCREARVEQRDAERVRATLVIAKGPLAKSFTTVNRLHPEHRIELELERGPFRKLDGEWNFTALGDDGCKVSLDLEFEFSNRLLTATIGPVFNEIANTMVTAFCDRARALYG